MPGRIPAERETARDDRRRNGRAMQRALVTGASRGVGRALVAELAGRGLDAAAAARRVEDLAGPPAAQRLPPDVTSDASVTAAARSAGPVDLPVNNAAVSAAAAAGDTPAGAARAMLDTNAAGPLRLISAFLPASVSPAAGQAVFPLNGVHAASKHAPEALSEAPAMKAGPPGIRVQAARLGGVATSMYHNQ